MRRVAFVVHSLAALPLALTLTTTARAADPAAAQALFDDAKRLMSQHQFVEACAKFDESQHQDPGIGTLFRYADCEERIGKTATAWASFLEVAAEAKAQGESARATAAHDRAAALEGKLARLTIEPGAESTTPGLQLLRDGTPIGPGQWAIPVPVDPGDHVVEAHAPGKGSWSTTVRVRDAARSLVTVPLLADAPVAAAVPPSPLPQETAPDPRAAGTTTTTAAEVPAGSRGGAQRAAGAVLTVAGVAGLGVGAYFGVISLARHDDAQAHCTGNLCDASGVSLRDDARRAGTASTIALSVGGAALVGGLVTFFTAPHAQDTHPEVAIGPGTVVLRGRW